MNHINIQVAIDSQEVLTVPAYKVTMCWNDEEARQNPSQGKAHWYEYIQDSSRNLEKFKEYVRKAFPDCEILHVEEIQVKVW